MPPSRGTGRPWTLRELRAWSSAPRRSAQFRMSGVASALVAVAATNATAAVFIDGPRPHDHHQRLPLADTRREPDIDATLHLPRARRADDFVGMAIFDCSFRSSSKSGAGICIQNARTWVCDGART